MEIGEWFGQTTICWSGAWSATIGADGGGLFGNANVNDIYIRAAGKWASQLGGSGIVIRDNGRYPFGSCPGGKSFLGAISASGLAVATAAENWWNWPGQVWFCG